MSGFKPPRAAVFGLELSSPSSSSCFDFYSARVLAGFMHRNECLRTPGQSRSYLSSRHPV